ncbi:putative General secretion pathway protein D [Desulfamplus magnetovallimortis]|uniref:Putative General secretion pathway protein D n=1 Tax=Desulfamplus magnetovallimortis TaxID=1246637 RepID=A0A1W1HD17_9BACT|nr:type II secretion system secretin GspD [Desulfamplus magnetovallimortis]SLM30370.1 putative General secretion pathway protein D [Desulfamplus magnetovallimortis]
MIFDSTIYYNIRRFKNIFLCTSGTLFSRAPGTLLLSAHVTLLLFAALFLFSGCSLHMSDSKMALNKKPQLKVSHGMVEEFAAYKSEVGTPVDESESQNVPGNDVDVAEGDKKKTPPSNPFESFIKAHKAKAIDRSKSNTSLSKDDSSLKSLIKPEEQEKSLFDSEDHEESLVTPESSNQSLTKSPNQSLTKSPDQSLTKNSDQSLIKTVNEENSSKTASVDDAENGARISKTADIGDAVSKTENSETVKVELAFDNADLFEVLDATLFELFKVNYIIDPHVKAKLTFHFSGDYTKVEFIELLNEILQLSNLSITRGPGDIYKVVRKSESASLSSEPLFQDDLPDASGDISRLIKLKYLDASAVAKNIRHFTTKGSQISTDTVNNSVVVTDTRENIEKVLTVISLMDIPYFTDIAWRIFPVKEAEAKDLVSDITKIIRSSGLYYRPGAVRGGYQILAIDSMNAILLVTRWPEMLDLVEKWVAAMDHMGGDAGGGTGVFIYFVENGTAAELSEILKQLYGGKKSSSDNKTQIVKPVAPAPRDKPDEKKASDQNEEPELPELPELPGSSGSGDISGEIEIIADETNNAIVFKASQRDYKIIKSVLKELDVVPRQVLINVVIAEVTLSDNIEYGVQWLMNNTIGDYEAQGSWDGSESSRAFNQTLGSNSNFTYGIYSTADILAGSADALKALITALDEDSELNVLSSPNIMAVDNKEAYIEVGQDVPTVTGTVTDSNGGVTNTVQYQKTGIILKVTPHINSSGLVKMELSQEVSSAGSTTGAGGNYSINTRKAETSLVVSDGQTIILGGLMERTTDSRDSGIPFLKDIPFIGSLFKSYQSKTTKTELIFLLTPHVVDSRSDADRVTREFSGKIKDIREFIGTGQ